MSDEEWDFVAPYLTLMQEDAPQRDHALREGCDGLRWFVRAGATWRRLPPGTRLRVLPPWHTIYQQTRRWLDAGVFATIAQDLRMLLREIEGRAPPPTAVVLDGRTLHSSPESGARAGYDGPKKRKGAKVHLAVDTLGHLLALTVTPANEQERTPVGELVAQVQEATGETVQIAFVDQGYTGPDAAVAAAAHGIRLAVVELPAATRGFVLLPRRWVVERSFAWLARFRRLARDYERSPDRRKGLHLLAFTLLLLKRFVIAMAPYA